MTQQTTLRDAILALAEALDPFRQAIGSGQCWDGRSLHEQATDLLVLADAATLSRRTRTAASDLRSALGHDADDGPTTRCDVCEIEPEERTCTDCGATAVVVDCGHSVQPVEIAGSGAISGGGDPVCEDCEAARIEAQDAVRSCECGEPIGNPCFADDVEDADALVVEWMPWHLRASHEAAGNRGRWPLNGALRLRCLAEHADLIVEDDPDWSEIVSAPEVA